MVTSRRHVKNANYKLNAIVPPGIVWSRPGAVTGMRPTRRRVKRGRCLCSENAARRGGNTGVGLALGYARGLSAYPGREHAKVGS